MVAATAAEASVHTSIVCDYLRWTLPSVCERGKERRKGRKKSTLVIHQFRFACVDSECLLLIFRTLTTRQTLVKVLCLHPLHALQLAPQCFVCFSYRWWLNSVSYTFHFLPFFFSLPLSYAFHEGINGGIQASTSALTTNCYYYYYYVSVSCLLPVIRTNLPLVVPLIKLR